MANWVPTNLRNVTNQIIDSISDNFIVSQESFFQGNGRYMQCRDWSGAVPADCNSVFTNASIATTDNDDSWSSLGVPLPPTSNIRMSVHSFRSKNNTWYELVVTSRVNNNLFRAVYEKQGGSIGLKYDWNIWRDS